MDYSAIKEILSSKKNIVITAHKSPDGDAIGSTLALKQVLDKLGHDVKVIVPDAFPKFLNWMKGTDSIVIFDRDNSAASELIEKADIIFCLDYNDLSRVGGLGKFIEVAKAQTVLIDHHLSPSPIFDFVLSDTSASSTAELIFNFVNEIGAGNLIDEGIAECLYAGIVTDTGSFRFSSTSASTHDVAASLMRSGLQPASVHQKVYDTNSMSRLRLIGHALTNKLEVIESKRAAIIPISLQEKNRFSYKKGDTEGLVNYGLSLEGVEVAVLLSEELGFVKFSFRSKGLINVNEIARAAFNGGGHRNAAGGIMDGSLDQAIAKLKSELEKIEYD